MKLGLLSMCALEVDPVAVDAALLATAANFLGAGGTVTLAEWSSLVPEERRALWNASRALVLENARTLAREIIRGQLSPAELLAEPVAAAKAPDEPAGAVAP